MFELICLDVRVDDLGHVFEIGADFLAGDVLHLALFDVKAQGMGARWIGSKGTDMDADSGVDHTQAWVDQVELPISDALSVSAILLDAPLSD